MFYCDNNWDNYQNYTGNGCNITQLKKGWCGFTPELFFDKEYSKDYYKIIVDGKNFDIYFHLKKWYIKILHNYTDDDSIIYCGLIPTNRFAFNLFGNLNILEPEEIVKINRELLIDEIIENC